VDDYYFLDCSPEHKGAIGNNQAEEI